VKAVLILNAGSSSLKFALFPMTPKLADMPRLSGQVEGIGAEPLMHAKDNNTGERFTEALAVPPDTDQNGQHRLALEFIFGWINRHSPGVEIVAAGHRIVHGGEKLTRSVLIDDAVVDQIEDCIDLAPLHNPANLKGIYSARELFGHGIPQVAVFDTSFHSTMPPESFLYAIPYQLYVRHKVRRYGFHGTSHRYVAYRYRQLTGMSHEETNIVTVHLGNGCSACAIRGGDSLDTSMGMTPAEGLVMGTRGGDLDPSVLEFLHHKEGMSFEELDGLVNKRSGLLGISGLTNDMRDLLEEEREHQDRRAHLAIEIFCLRVKKYLGSYLARMNGADAIVFTGGIGENSADIRSRVCRDLDFFGIVPDEGRNATLFGGKEGEFGAEGSRVKLYVIPTNEELLIARDTVRCVRDVPRRW